MQNLLCQKYNALSPNQQQEKQELLISLLGSAGENSVIEPNFSVITVIILILMALSISIITVSFSIVQKYQLVQILILDQIAVLYSNSPY